MKCLAIGKTLCLPVVKCEWLNTVGNSGKNSIIRLIELGMVEILEWESIQYVRWNRNSQDKKQLKIFLSSLK